MKSAIETIFSDAVESGFLKPTLRTKNLVFSAAPATGRNPGAIYIKTQDHEYCGKIARGEIHLMREFYKYLPEVKETMNSPRESAIKYGRETGQCSICGRQLDNAVSIYNAIGPICADKLGFPLLPIPKLDISDL